MAVNRYKQLLSVVPQGSFYDSNGQVLPYRDTPYELRLSTGVADREYAIYVNNGFRGATTTNSQAVAIVNVSLDKGDNEVKLVDSVTLAEVKAYITTREYATMLASVAEVIEGIDSGVEQVLLDARLVTASAALIEDVFGTTVNAPNDAQYSLDVYRELLQELRTAYRYYGGTTEGISRVVRAFTQISPLVYPSSFGPVWILGKNMLSPRVDLGGHTNYPTSATLAGLQGTGAGLSVVSISKSVPTGSASIQVDGTTSPKRVRYASAKTVSINPGPWVDITANGSYTLYDGMYTPSIGSNVGPYNISAGVNDKLELEISNKGRIAIILTAGAARTAAQVAADINNALAADPRYGAGYNNAAYGSAGVGSEQVVLVSPPATSNVEPVTIHAVSSNNDASQTIFDLPISRGGLNAAVSIGATSLILNAASDIDAWPNATSLDPLPVILGRTTYHASGAAPSPVATSDPELVYVTHIDTGTKTLTLKDPIVKNHDQHSLVELAGQLPFNRYAKSNNSPITINITDITKLPTVLATDNFTVSGSGLPDGIVMTDNVGAAVSSAGYVKADYFDTDFDLPTEIPANRIVTIPVPDEILKYKGFKLLFSIWGSPSDFEAATPHTDILQMGVSYDGSTFTMSAPTTDGKVVRATGQPKLYYIESTISSTATNVKLRLTTDANANGKFGLHRIRVTVPVSHSGLFLGDGTIPRNASKSKSGSFMYVWSRDQLSSAEKNLLGLTTVNQESTGHIDTIFPTSVWLEKFNPCTYTSGVANEVKGVFTDGNFISGTRTNLDLNLRTPARFTHLVPSVTSDQSEEVAISFAAPYLATLSVESDQDQSKATLFEDGVPLHKDEWSFTNATTIEKTTAPVLGAVYEFRYNALIRFQSAIIDLGASFADYMWAADSHVFSRVEIAPIEVSVDVGVQFDGEGIAVLPDKSNGDQLTASLIEDTGISKNVVPTAQWSFVDTQRIRINQSVFNSNALYTIKYVAVVNHPEPQADVKMEIRSGATSGDVSAASWSEFKPNQVVDGSKRYHQLRVTISNVRDTRDVRIQSLLLKGLGLFGTGLTVPVLRS